MTWCLLSFASPCLALADHPVVAWPIRAGSRFAERADPAKVGVLNFLEVRLPVAADLALLTAWADRPDLPKPLRCASHHARNLNAFSIAEAERHWIHRPGATVRAGAGPWMPLSTELIENYSVSAAERSQARAATSEDLNSRLGDESREVNIRFIEQPTPPMPAQSSEPTSLAKDERAADTQTSEHVQLRRLDGAARGLAHGPDAAR